ncbi:MAG: hypothetical protein LQ340_005519 [Diploschistes diacapsis]|nr:MAG: hypothetical protein LQ340_005519 [Diploschistes diacapsis]
MMPIGDHRRKHLGPSRGKRDRKSKRAKAKIAAVEQSAALPESKPSPPPEILEGITVGYNSTHRALEALVQPVGGIMQSNERTSGPVEAATIERTSRKLAAVFIDRSAQPKIMYHHLPLLVSAASSRSEEEAAIHLVPLPNGSEGKLANALNIPRVGLVGIYEEAYGAKPLLAAVRERVSVVGPSWLQIPREGTYLPLKIDTTTRKVPVLPAKAVRRQEAQQGDEAVD